MIPEHIVVDGADVSEAELARRIAGGDTRAFEALMRRCNRRLFRIARGILGNDSDAEDALQDAYLTAYLAMSGFRGDAKLTTWLARIVINQALTRLRKSRRAAEIIPIASSDHDNLEPEEERVPDDRRASPEDAALRAQLRALLERRIDALPAAFRTVFIMREVEEMTVEETAEALGIPEATVRTRLFRAKSLLRAGLAAEIDMTLPDAYAFDGVRCDRIVCRVLERIARPNDL